MQSDTLINLCYRNADPAKAPVMAAYMKNRFPFLGIPAPTRRKLAQPFLKAAGAVDWDFVNRCWNLPEREFQYLACDYLRTLQSSLTEADVPKLEKLAVTESWWDTADSLDRTIGNINFPSDKIDAVMLAWSEADNIWLRRIAIDHQLLRKSRTKSGLLARILVNNLRQDEFFINKAMG